MVAGPVFIFFVNEKGLCEVYELYPYGGVHPIAIFPIFFEELASVPAIMIIMVSL